MILALFSALKPERKTENNKLTKLTNQLCQRVGIRIWNIMEYNGHRFYGAPPQSEYQHLSTSPIHGLSMDYPRFSVTSMPASTASFGRDPHYFPAAHLTSR